MQKTFLNHIELIMGNILFIYRPYVPNVAYISPIAVSYIIKIKEGSRHTGRQQSFKEGSRHAIKVIFQLF